VSDVESDHRQGRQHEQPRDAAEYPATPPAPRLAAEYPNHQHWLAWRGGAARRPRAREEVLAGSPPARGN
jgi:hypothetical protein